MLQSHKLKITFTKSTDALLLPNQFMWKAVHKPWTEKCYLKKPQFISCMANYQDTTGNLLEKLWELTSRLSISQRRNLGRNKGWNYDLGNLLYHWEILVLNYNLNEGCFPRRTTAPLDQIEITVSISKSNCNTSIIKYAVINIFMFHTF